VSTAGASSGVVRVTTALPVSLDQLRGLAKALVAKDPDLWGADARDEAAQRLGWLDLPETSQAVLPQLRALRQRFAAAELDHVVLAGMGGSSLAPEVITRTAGVELTVLDSTDPHQVGAALADRLERTVVVVASKSGGTAETDSHYRAYTQAFIDAGIDPAGRIVVVTDPGSPLEERAREAGQEVVLADPNVGGRYSALSAFGLTPSLLAGADVERLLADARVLSAALADDEDNAGIELGAAMGQGALAGRDKLALADHNSGLVGFGDWAEQLIAESTGKEGKGILPVVVEGLDAPGFVQPRPDVHRVVLGRAPEDLDGTTVSGSLGAQFLLWEYATAVAGRILGINPFDQPNVSESKDNTKKILDAAGDGPLPEGEPALVDGDVAVYGDLSSLGAPRDLAGVLAALLTQVPDRGYLAIMAYLNRNAESAAAALRPRLCRRTDGRATTFGWAPRFLHSTGQFHKGGPQAGVFLQITGAVERDVPVPGRPYTFGRLQMAQALGDLGALVERRRPVLRLHLLHRGPGVQQLLAASEARV
jgi:glucose-6-phosphate isomerase